MTLNDLTKEELIWLIHRHAWNIRESDIALARIERLNKQSSEMRKRALKIMDEAVQDKTVAGRQKFNEASQLFDRAMEISQKASALHKQYFHI